MKLYLNKTQISTLKNCKVRQSFNSFFKKKIVPTKLLYEQIYKHRDISDYIKEKIQIRK